jgi:hypothetical protein
LSYGWYGGSDFKDFSEGFGLGGNGSVRRLVDNRGGSLGGDRGVGWLVDGRKWSRWGVGNRGDVI